MITKVYANDSELSPIDLLAGDGSGVGVNDITEIATAANVLGFIFNIALGLGVAIAFFYLAIAIINYAQSGNNPENLKKANMSVIWVLIAIALITISYSIRTAIVKTLDVDVQLEHDPDPFLDRCQYNPTAPECQ